VLADPQLIPFFEGIPMSRLKAHQASFLSHALGGPKQYGGAKMDAAHARFAIQQIHFDLVAKHLVETLQQLGVSDALVTEVIEAIAPLAPQIVNTPTPCLTH
jgi:hemoglobin